jgi:mannosyltransferase OCH1-like enzyme
VFGIPILPLILFMSISSFLLPKLNQPPNKQLIAAVERTAGIPKIFHQTFYDRTLPEELQRSVAHLKALHPDWEYRFYDDKDIAEFIQNNYPGAAWDYFHRIDSRYGAARADLFRYLLLYKAGGVYLDIKSGVTEPLDGKLRSDDQFIISQWDAQATSFPWGRHDELRNIPGGEYQQWFIASAPGHPYLKAVIDTVLNNIDAYDPIIHGTGKYGVLRLTGPIAYTLAIERVLGAAPHRFADSKKELGLSYNVYSGQSHQTTFRSHYSLQTAPVVHQLGGRKLMNRVYAVLQKLYHMVKRR